MPHWSESEVAKLATEKIFQAATDLHEVAHEITDKTGAPKSEVLEWIASSFGATFVQAGTNSRASSVATRARFRRRTE